ncbi:MAG: M15 family metallopeptidase [Candidatus Kapaibacterium sp.]
MKALKVGSRGSSVKDWQFFLIGQGYTIGVADGIFGKKTETATKEFQAKHNLTADGIVGNQTFAKAMLLGFELVDGEGDPNNKRSPLWPPKPDFKPLTGTRERQQLFGRYDYTHKPIPGNRENIAIHGSWERDNIVKVNIPQLVGVKSAPRSGDILFHRLASQQVADLFKAWEEAGLMDRVLTWAGSYVPRLVRGGRSLSNHAFGTAFDINVPWNGLGVRPALVGEKGSVRELVPIAHKHGFYWGGHFSRQDGMHFEVAKVRK